MENLNLKIAQINTEINQILNGIPIGVAYLILKTKTKELEQIYYDQIEKEYDAVTAQQQPIDQTENEQIQTEIQDEPTTA